jgi:dipeptidyl aminopeptidase/acylaminoacyl peptidase
LRTDESNRFGSVAEVGIYDLSSTTTRFVTSADQQELSASYFHWVSPDTLFVEYTDRANRGLYRLSLDDGSTIPVWAPEADAKGFSFDEKNRRAIWLQESADQPPEVYTDRRPLDEGRKISSLNDSLHDLWFPSPKSITWMSTDGTKVQGWLIQPGNRAQADPPPLLVLVHGGPGAVTTNRFGPYRGWPYPVQIFAARGYAVFIPNYRQTDSFGKDFQKISGLDEEPVDDIVTGIEHLLGRGEAAQDRIGIMGYSWGGRLAPLVAAEKPIIQAASIAEGVGLNPLSNYGQGSGFSGIGVREYHVGANPYEKPSRYLEPSPVFRSRFTKTTPTLLEYGQKGEVIQGLELGRALWRQGTPHKFVIYPGTGHGLRKPAQLLESMRRNLEWFERWIPTGSPSSESR